MLIVNRTFPCFFFDDFLLHDFVVDDVFLYSFFLTTIEQILNEYRKRIDEWIYELFEGG